MRLRRKKPAPQQKSTPIIRRNLRRAQGEAKRTQSAVPQDPEVPNPECTDQRAGSPWLLVVFPWTFSPGCSWVDAIRETLGLQTSRVSQDGGHSHQEAPEVSFVSQIAPHD